MKKEYYFDLSLQEQGDILAYYANKLSIRDTILEKDIWLCWVLEVIFGIANKKPMAFKGGTSLSKVFNAINRFSEDIDITLDYRHFGLSDPIGASKSQQKRISEQLKVKVKEYRDDTIVPALKLALGKLSKYNLNVDDAIQIDDSGEKIFFYYPSALNNQSTSDDYIQERVLIELGGRNVIDPNAIHIVKPYIAEKEEKEAKISFPEPKITVLSPNRTFWEKASLIHVECHRGIRENAERLSRHWYDLVKLYENKNIGPQAINDSQLLENVIKHKKIFFNASYANYDECLKGNFLLSPDESGLLELRKDYNNMLQSGMIYDGNKYTFEYIIEKIREISDKLNNKP